MKEFKVKVKLYGLDEVYRIVAFTGDREGYIETPEGVKTGEFSFTGFNNMLFKSAKDGRLYESAKLPLEHITRYLFCGIRDAYDKRRQAEWAQK
jgi:hypothetical protein